MWWSRGDWGWGGWLVMTLAMVGVWAALIWARGEIDEAEYRRRIDTLHGRTTSATQKEGTS